MARRGARGIVADGDSAATGVAPVVGATRFDRWSQKEAAPTRRTSAARPAYSARLRLVRLRSRVATPEPAATSKPPIAFTRSAALAKRSAGSRSRQRRIAASQSGIEVGHVPARRGRRLLEALDRDAHGRAALEGALARDHLEDHDAERVDVGGRGELLPSTCSGAM